MCTKILNLNPLYKDARVEEGERNDDARVEEGERNGEDARGGGRERNDGKNILVFFLTRIFSSGVLFTQGGLIGDRGS